MRTPLSTRCVRPTQDAGANRPARIGLLLAAVGLGCLVVGALAGPALAQQRGPNPLTLPLFDWDVDVQPNANIEKRDLVFAYRRGVRDLKAGKCRSATQKFSFVLDYVDNDPHLYYVAGTAARCARAFKMASGYYESSLEFDPERYEAAKFLGISRLAMGDLASATDALGLLALRREDCEGACDERLESSYQDLKKAVETARALSENETETE